MGWWQVDADTLARSRFVISRLAEATASLMALEMGTAGHPGAQAWLDSHRGAYQERLARDPVTALLVRAALGMSSGRHWCADFLAPTPTGTGDPTFLEELRTVRETPAATAAADLEVSLRGPLPAALRRNDLPARVAELLEWVWEETVLPYWARRRRVLEADVVARTASLSRGGWAAALNDLRPGMRWLGDNRLQINAHEYPPRQISGAQLLFVPVTPAHSWATWDEPHRYALVYPCSGALSDPDRSGVPASLRTLLGPSRADVLVLLADPKSTTQLVALTGQALGSVGRHLKILHDAGLITRRRSGRSVLYFRAAVGEALVAAGSAS